MLEEDADVGRCCFRRGTTISVEVSQSRGQSLGFSSGSRFNGLTGKGLRDGPVVGVAS